MGAPASAKTGCGRGRRTGRRRARSPRPQIPAPGGVQHGEGRPEQTLAVGEDGPGEGGPGLEPEATRRAPLEEEPPLHRPVAVEAWHEEEVDVGPVAEGSGHRALRGEAAVHGPAGVPGGGPRPDEV